MLNNQRTNYYPWDMAYLGRLNDTIWAAGGL